MKCIKCGANSAYKQRRNGKCRSCFQPFAFEPKEMDRRFVLTDKAFAAAIDAVSDDGALYFTPRQLYYQVMRPMLKRSVLPGSLTSISIRTFIFAIVAFSVLFAVTQSFWAGVLGAVAPCAIGLLIAASQPAPGTRLRLAPPPPIDFMFFTNRLLKRWIDAHGPPEKMLPDHPDHPASSAGGVSRDVTQFSFDRLLVADKAETAALLITNNLHFETSMPIVSIDGYPPNVFGAVMEMVRRNPRLKVFALHDADPAGCTLPLRLREDPAWFPLPDVAVYDAGLRPRHVALMPGLIVQGGTKTVDLPPSLARSLSPGERRWLAAGYVAELATMKPSRLMKAIYGYISRAGDEEQAMRAEAVADQRGFFQTRVPGGSG